MPKPLVDILDEIFENSRWPNGNFNPDKAKQAIIKAIKERVPEKEDANELRPIDLQDTQTRLEQARRIGHNSAIDQLNQNLWGRDE